MKNECLIPLEKAKIRKGEIFAQEFLKGFCIKHKVYRLKKLFADYYIVCKTPKNSQFKNIIIEVKQFFWRKNFYQGILELLAANNELGNENEMWIVCKKFYNITYSNKKRYKNATFLKILKMFKVKVVELE